MTIKQRILCFKTPFIGTIVVVATFPAVVAAGEVYGRLSEDGRVLPNVSVSMSCPSFSQPKTVTTDRTGVYRISGPAVEEKCTVKVNQLNAVPIYTSTGRTRVNLEIVAGMLIRR
jgi:hypothetical protein